jgi:aryl-alcohol dehydrogenase-like predicted oxidoreductase
VVRGHPELGSALGPARTREAPLRRLGTDRVDGDQIHWAPCGSQATLLEPDVGAAQALADRGLGGVVRSALTSVF